MKSSGVLTETALIAHIARLPKARASFKQLIRELGARGTSRSDLETLLARMTARGELIEYRSGYYVLAERTREYAVGRLRMHRDGYGFVIPDRKIEWLSGDVFLPSDRAEKAMNGDRVIVRLTRIDSDGRAEGEIIRILKRAHSTVVGEFRVHRRGNFVVPHDERLRDWILIPEGLEIPQAAPPADRIGTEQVTATSAEDLDGYIVDVELLDYPEHGEHAVGRVIEILGHPDDFGIDVEIVIRKYHLPHRFPAEAAGQAARIPASVSEEDAAQRVDFRDLDVVTIDGETARDFDDAVWVEKLPGGHFALQVHIADVGHYVTPGTPIDAEAFNRGTSVYFPDRAVPMLPVELSTGICSLRPGVDRLVLSVLLEIDRQGDVVSQKFARGVIRSAARLTYTEVHLLLEGDAGVREKLARLAERLETMRELALILNRKRVHRGSIDFDLPEPFIEFDEWGEMTGVSRAPRNIAHRVIEEFMLAANEAVASHLENSGIPTLFRIHEPPDPARVMEFEDLAIHFGYSLGFGALPVKRFPIVDRKRDGRKIRKDIVLADERLEVSPRLYQQLTAKLEGKPEERIINYLMLRSLKQARYSADNAGHFALAAPAYTHFTSPIRRYPDLVVHRILAATLDNKPSPAMDLTEIAEDCSESERRAADAERELVEWKKVKFMAGRLGDEFAALIISTTRAGFFVELKEMFIEGFVPIETLTGDRYGYQENTRRITGERTKKAYSIGDSVNVRLDRADAVERKLQFSVTR